jgi:ATP-dependent Clp protease ATP-binding subunit ClpA
MFERFTNQSRRAVVLAQEEARMLNHDYIGTEHLLLGLLHEGKGSAAQALNAMGVTLGAARDQVVAIIGRGQVERTGHIPFTPRAKKSLELSLREALQLGHGYIATGHLLLGLTHQGDSVAVKMLGELGADLKDLNARVIQELHDNPEGHDVPAAERERPRRVVLSPDVLGLLDTIGDRLSAIEQRLGIAQPVPAALRRLDERIAQVRRDKEAAVEVRDFGQAAALRDTEKQLLAERSRVEQEVAGAAGEGSVGADVAGADAASADAASADAAGEGSVGEGAAGADVGGADVGGADVGGADVAGEGTASETVAAAEVGEVAGETGELAWLRTRVARLEARLREHGIDPDEPREPPAVAG